METINVVINDNEKPLLIKMDDKEELFFQPSGNITSPIQTKVVAPSCDTGVLNDGNNSSPTQKKFFFCSRKCSHHMFRNIIPQAPLLVIQMQVSLPGRRIG